MLLLGDFEELLAHRRGPSSHCPINLTGKLSGGMTPCCSLPSSWRSGNSSCMIIRPVYPYSTLVKIWFQNKRSKYKKLLKQNSGGQEGDFPGRSPSLSPCSPPLPSLWDLPKAGALPTSGYGNNFGAWYQHHSPDVLAPPQMM
ncbi:hypothetical protein E2I00_015655 [Balaenoptera physalus]|uniref:Homeobox domain-containing protein n=1 Tax=Balaenoptera physalus TaxID=9770 RepID=A0A643C2M8_BALPH|nr:hypothetical protein E2I00_015655 [Balaenoptera physalus]